MPLATITLENLKIHVRDPLHIGTGFARGLVNRTVIRGRDGLVYVPGSALKGKVRDACETLARLHQIGNCQSPHPHELSKSEHRREQCVICRIFGAPAQPSTLRWHSAALSAEWAKILRPFARAPAGQLISKTQVQLSRTRGLAAEARLFTSEFAAEGLTFVAQPALTGRMQLTAVEGANNVYYELVLLLAGLKMVNALGGNLSRGAGACEFELPEHVRVDGRLVSITAQLEAITELEYYGVAAEDKV